MDWIVLKQIKDGGKRTYGPISAPSAAVAVRRLAEGTTEDHAPYSATEHGRYHAIPLDLWQSGTFDYTKTRGIEPVAPKP